MTLTMKEAKKIMMNNDGNLDLKEKKITKLPDNLKVDGYLDITDTKITKLPDNLEVYGFLDIRGTKITELPDNLQVRGCLYLNDTIIDNSYNKIKIICKDCDIPISENFKNTIFDFICSAEPSEKQKKIAFDIYPSIFYRYLEY